MRPLVFIGVASYSIYLVHDPVMAWYGLYGGTNVVFACLIGVLTGVIFWMACERYFVSPALRTPGAALVDWIITRLAVVLRLPGSMRLGTVAASTPPIEVVTTGTLGNRDQTRALEVR
ncbi:MAG: hypothetical protein GIW99_09355 [Candidatus Eremiobacteraeota bacterium]|nr:hypothetical protein [Candidatus Eremiobacteraeota bacterium]